MEGAYLGPVYLRHVHLPGAPLTTHAGEQQEAHLRAPALLRLDPPCPRRARFDQNNRAWRTWLLLWGKEAVQNVGGSEQEQKAILTSTEMRACSFSGLPGGYPEAQRAGASQKNACSLQSSAPCETTWSANNFDLRQVARAPSIVARVNQAAVPHEPPRC